MTFLFTLAAYLLSLALFVSGALGVGAVALESGGAAVAAWVGEWADPEADLPVRERLAEFSRRDEPAPLSQPSWPAPLPRVAVPATAPKVIFRDLAAPARQAATARSRRAAEALEAVNAPFARSEAPPPSSAFSYRPERNSSF